MVQCQALADHDVAAFDPAVFGRCRRGRGGLQHGLHLAHRNTRSVDDQARLDAGLVGQSPPCGS